MSTRFKRTGFGNSPCKKSKGIWNWCIPIWMVRPPLRAPYSKDPAVLKMLRRSRFTVRSNFYYQTLICHGDLPVFHGTLLPMDFWTPSLFRGSEGGKKSLVVGVVFLGFYPNTQERSRFPKHPAVLKTLRDSVNYSSIVFFTTPPIFTLILQSLLFSFSMFFS